MAIHYNFKFSASLKAEILMSPVVYNMNLLDLKETSVYILVGSPFTSMQPNFSGHYLEKWWSKI